ncbi:MAG: M48 family metallopeptidase [Neomegalonema sp.]
MQASADYFDGETAGRREVTARLDVNALRLSALEGAELARWPIDKIRRLPGAQAVAGELRLIPEFGSEARLVLRDPELIAAIENAATGLNVKPPAPRALQRKVLVWGGTAIASILAIVFVIAPLLANQIAQFIPPESEVALGESIANEIEAEGGFLMGLRPGACDAPEGLAALDKMVARLEPVADAHVPLSVKVLDSGTPNAFALPGGHIFLLSGLIKDAESPEEVAGVLAHEIGHVITRDPTRGALRTLGSAGVIGLLFGDFFGGFALTAMVDAAYNARYSREIEAQADATAIRILQAADVDPAPVGGFFRRLLQRFGDDDSYLASHPTHGSREEQFTQNANSDARPVLSEQEWAALRTICDE